MFWQGAFPTISFETMPEMIKDGGNVELDEDSVKDQVQKLMNRLQRYIALTGVHANQLKPDVGDPTPHLKGALELLCCSLGVPLKIFLGTESGHLAAMEDSKQWNDRISDRRKNYLTPKIIRPFIDRLALLGVLPKPSKLIIDWSDPNTQSDASKADIILKQCQAITQFAGGNATILP